MLAPPTEAPLRPGLYLVSLPIGNPEDITLRALRILRSADLVVAEHAPYARRLLASYGCTTPVTTYRTGFRPATEALLATIEAGAAVAYVSDAGSPGVLDPDSGLVRQTRAAGIPVFVVPGASCVTAAVSASGSGSSGFVFAGSAPNGVPERAAFFERLKGESRAILLCASHRSLRRTLRAIQAALGVGRRVVVLADMTKHSETFLEGDLSNAQIGRFGRAIDRGEIIVVVRGETEDSAVRG